MLRRLFIVLLLMAPLFAYAQGLPIMNVVTAKGGTQSYSLTLQLLGLYTVTQ